MPPELEGLLAQQDEAIERCRQSGVQAALSDAAYRSAKACEVLRLKASGMPATLCDLVCFAEKGVADARLQRDIAEANYAADKEVVQNNKRRIDVVREDIARGWRRAGEEWS